MFSFTLYLKHVYFCDQTQTKAEKREPSASLSIFNAIKEIKNGNESKYIFSWNLIKAQYRLLFLSFFLCHRYKKTKSSPYFLSFFVFPLPDLNFPHHAHPTNHHPPSPGHVTMSPPINTVVSFILESNTDLRNLFFSVFLLSFFLGSFFFLWLLNYSHHLISFSGRQK